MHVQLKVECNAVVIMKVQLDECLDSDNFRLLSDNVRSTAAASAIPYLS